MLKRLFFQSRLARGVAILAGGTALSQGLLALASPILTRLYSPEDYGMLSVYVSLVSVCVAVSGLRYSLAIPLPKDRVDGASLLFVSMMSVVLTSLLLGNGIVVLAVPLTTWLGVPELSRYLWILPFSMFGAGIYDSLKGWFLRKKEYPPLARTSFVQASGQIGVQLLFGVSNFGPLGLFLGDGVGRTAGAGSLAVSSLRRDRDVFREVSATSMWTNAVRYRRFPLVSTWSALLNNLGQHVAPLLLASLYGPQAAGLFALSQRVMGTPMTLVGTAIAQVYLSELASLARENSARMQELFLRSSKTLFLIGLGPIALIWLLGPWLFGIVFGSAWVDAGRFVRYLSFMYLIQFVVTPISQTLNVLERQDLQFAWDAGRLIVVTLAILGSASAGWPPVIATGAFGCAMTMAYAFQWWLCHRTLQLMRLPNET